MEQIIGDLKESSLKTVCVLGEGTYGSLSLQNDSKLDKLYVKKTSILKQYKSLEKELRIMLRFHNNPFIVRASTDHLHFETNTKSMSLCSIYMEYASLGNLDKIISDAGGRLPEDSVRRATRMILQGLKALHSEGYVHCNLKPSNVLIFPFNTPGEPWDLKLAGFGLSKEPTMDPTLLSVGIGTLEYMPPEAIEQDRFVGLDRLIGPACDIWSLGRTVLKMFGGAPVEIKGSNTWRLHEDISPVAKDFVRRCLAWEPKNRATVDELLDHSFAAEKLPLYLSFLRFPSFVKKITKEQLHASAGHEELIPKPQGLIW